jgi:glycosyltransferase involved in cell wall biosynthesis
MGMEKNIKLWSSLGMRATLGMIAMDLAKKYPDLMITTSDVSTSAGLDRFRKKYPEKFVDVGIAEQNLIGVSAGLSSEGFKVISTTFAPFQTLRCCEQIKVNLGYMKNKVCMIGLASGLVLGNLGFTHCCIEDVGSLRSIPNITIVVPSDPFELFKVLSEAINYKESVSNINELIKVYDSTKIFILPSFIEGFPKVISESLARLRPVIIFEEIQYVVNEREGIFVCKRDDKSLIDTITFILKNYTDIQKKIEQNYFYTKDNFKKEILTLFQNEF